MRDYLTIGSSPWSEECAQVGSDNFRSQAIRECNAFIKQIRRVVGPEPVGAKLKVKWFMHDFGQYAEVVCEFYGDNPESENYAFECEGHALLNNWDEDALIELAMSEHELAQQRLNKIMTLGAVLDFKRNT